MRRERVPIRDKKEAVVLFLKLQPVRERSEIMAEMKAAGGPHAAQDSFTFCHAEEYILLPQQIASDHHALHLAGALVNGENARIAIHPLHVTFARITQAAVN